MLNQLLPRPAFRPLLLKFSVTCTIMLSAILFSPFLNGKLQAQTYNGSLTLTTQDAVNAFNYSEITGGLSINSFNSGSPVTDLSPLSKLTKTGSLSITLNPLLTSLKGLENLSDVGYFSIESNASLTALADFRHLTSVKGDFFISNNASLPSLAGLDHISTVAGYFVIGGNKSLQSLAGLDNLTSTPVLDILDNNALTSIAVLKNLTSVNWYLEILSNPSLTSLAGLEKLDLTSNGSLNISNNLSLTSLTALSHLSSIAGGLYITNNSALLSLSGLDHITSVGSKPLSAGINLNISGNSSLASIAALDHVTQIGGNLSIQRNPWLSTCCILPSLITTVKGSVIIADNAAGCNNLADISAACTRPAVLSVSYTDGSGQQTTGNTLRPGLQINNEGTSALAYKNMSIRYWLTIEDFSSIHTSINWAQLGTSLVSARYVPLPQPRSGAYGYIEYVFADGADSLASGSNSGPILSQISKADWTDFNQADDYSYATSADYTKNSHITAYYNGTLVWGTEPAAVTRTQNLKAYSASRDNSATTGSIGTTVQVNNEGNAPIGYPDITVRYWFTADGSQPLLYQLDYAKMGQLGIKSRFVTLPAALPVADTYLELGFTAADSLYPLSSTGNLLQHIRKNDWSAFDQLNDYSYLNATSPAENAKMTVYVKGALVYGTEPTASSVLPATLMQKATGAVPGEQTDLVTALDVTVLGNPVRGNMVEMMISGAQRKRIVVTVSDALGRVVSKREVIAGQRFSMPVSNAATQQLYIRVSAGREMKTVGVLRVK